MTAPARSGPDPIADRYTLMLGLKAAGAELAHIAGRISGQQAATAGDIDAAEQALQQARLALDHFKSRNPS